MQRIIAMLLFVVFLLGPSAPALAALQPQQPVACHRPVETGLAPSPAATPSPESSPAMAHCHDMAPTREAQTPESPDSTFSPNNCCTDHDCCHRHDRNRWVYLAPIEALHPIAASTAHVVLASAPAHASIPSNDHSGRAPPAL